MMLKLFVAVSILAAAPIVPFAQTDNATDEAPKPTVEELQALVQTISSDKAKLKVYCEISKLEEEMDKALEDNDEKPFNALSVQRDRLEQQIGPAYVKAMDGLAEVDPNSDEGKKFTAILEPLHNVRGPGRVRT
jgi:hypothetical protein